MTQAGRTTGPRTGAIRIPIYQTSTVAHPGLGQSTGCDYSRTTNPTRQALEHALAVLGGGAAALAFASGLAALTTARIPSSDPVGAERSAAVTVVVRKAGDSAGLRATPGGEKRV